MDSRTAASTEVESPKARGLWAFRAALVGALVTSLPAAGVAVFVFDADRNDAGDSVSIVFFVALVLLLSTPFWPVGRERSRSARVEEMVLLWCAVTFTVHLTWELGWLLLRDAIRAAPDEIWAYPWWAYIDGGDARYATNDSTLIAIESLSVLNGVVGVLALGLRRRLHPDDALPTLLLMATAVVHLYSATLYFATEALEHFPNVDTTSFVDLFIKFWLLNGLWLVVPLVVLRWGYASLRTREASAR